MMRSTLRRSPLRLAAFGACLPLLLVACSKSEPAATAPPEGSSSSTSAVAVNSGAVIDITEFAFNPGQVQLKVGQAVTWKNNGEATHQVAQDAPAGQPRAFDSAPIPPGQSFV